MLKTGHNHTGSYDFWIVRLVAICPRCDRSAMFATISNCSKPILRLMIDRTIGRTRGRAIINDWRRSIARSIVGNRATTGSDHRPIVRSIYTFDDRGTLRPITWSIVACCDRSDDLLTVILSRYVHCHPITMCSLSSYHDNIVNCHPSTICSLPSYHDLFTAILSRSVNCHPITIC